MGGFFVMFDKELPEHIEEELENEEWSEPYIDIDKMFSDLLDMKLDINEAYRVNLTLNGNETVLSPTNIRIYTDTNYVGGRRYIELDFGLINFTAHLENYNLNVTGSEVNLNIEIEEELEEKIINFLND